MYYTVTFEVQADDIAAAAHNIAIGQSIGNPNIRSEIETSQNIKEMEALVDSIEGNIVKIKFPLNKFDKTFSLITHRRNYLIELNSLLRVSIM